MASSITMTKTASFLGSSTTTRHPSTNVCRRGRGLLVVARASRVTVGEEKANNGKENSSSGRRDLVFAAAATTATAAVLSISSKVAMADEPKRGTPEAKKKYGPVCVTMPTARICRN